MASGIGSQQAAPANNISSGQTLGTVVKHVVADVVRSGDKFIIPEGMSAGQALELLERRVKYEEEAVVMVETYDVFPWDGAYVLDKVLQEKYGWVPALPTMSAFGKAPPQLIQIEVAPGEMASVPWGKFSLPKVDGSIETRGTMQGKLLVFQLIANVKRKHEDTIKKFFAAVREGTQKHSIYRGKAVSIAFTNDDGEPLDMPTPKFMHTDHIREEHLVFSRGLAEAVRTNLFTPIRRAHDCLNNGISLKRGVLLGGKYGCGKTMAAMVASKIAVDHGITFLYAKKAADLGQAVEFARQYQSPAAVVFVEDIDRDITGPRTEEMDEILNIIDGIDSKRANIIVVLTTNQMEKIHAAMLRPGRLDAVIQIVPPDAEAVQRLLRNYAQGMVSERTDLTRVGEVLKGQIPAVIAEVVKRASLSQLGLQERGTLVKEISAQALLEAAETMKYQLQLLDDEKPEKVRTSLDECIVDLMKDGLDESPRQIKMSKRLKSIATALDTE